MVSLEQTSISIVFPVKVLTNTTKIPVALNLGSAVLTI